MALRQSDLPQPITQLEVIENPNIVKCPCGCGDINLAEHAYIYSKATDEYYDGLTCLAESQGHRRSTDLQYYIVDGERYTRKQYIELYEVSSHG